MLKASAGILPYRFQDGQLQVFLVHPGGPFWAKKDLGSWSIAKGEFADEDPQTAAIREFTEETGFIITDDLLPLSPVKLASGKIVYAFAVQTDLDPQKIVSNTFELEWPPHSGQKRSFPEIDQAGWFSPTQALTKINPAQSSFVKELLNKWKQEK